MKKLTARQLQVLECIHEHLCTEGYPPTIRELGNALSIRSTNGVNDHLKALERKGFINRDDSKSRAIFLTPAAEKLVGRVSVGTAGPELVQVPLLGRIAAGVPIDAIEHIEETLQIDPAMIGGLPKEPVFALRVEGDSMIGDAILDGDIILVRKQNVARRGQIVAALVDGAATVKRYFPEGDHIRLVPSNPDMEDIVVTASEARETMLLGRVIAVHRLL